MKPALILILPALFTGCSFPIADKEAPAVNVIRTNSNFRINLPEDHTKGQSWNLAADFNRKSVQHLNTVWHGNRKGVDFNLRTKEAGLCTLHFTLRKYTDTLDQKVFVIDVKD
jgi:hypothetical protein